MKHGNFSIDLVFILIVVLSIFPYVFFKVKDKVPYPVKSSLKLQDFYILSILLTYLVIGGYTNYFGDLDQEETFLEPWALRVPILGLRGCGSPHHRPAMAPLAPSSCSWVGKNWIAENTLVIWENYKIVQKTTR